MLPPPPSLLRRFIGRFRRARLHRRIAAARALLDSADVWYGLDQLRIPGFGTDLVRIDFLPDVGPDFAAQRSSPRPAELCELFDRALPAARRLLAAVLSHAPAADTWPRVPDPARPSLPSWENWFLTPVDLVTLYGMVVEFRPARYVEIGSGMSTRTVHAACRATGSATEIVSIDPSPRVEVEALCHRAVRDRLEDHVDPVVALMRPGDFLFFDGSHRAFPGSDVTRFFVDVLPRLPAGVFVHIHDIYLPDDYPARAWDRLWSEQYLLAAWLLGGARGIEIILPCAELCRDPSALELLCRVPAFAEIPQPLASSSFWLRTTLR